MRTSFANDGSGLELDVDVVCKKFVGPQSLPDLGEHKREAMGKIR